MVLAPFFLNPELIHEGPCSRLWRVVSADDGASVVLKERTDDDDRLQREYIRREFEHLRELSAVSGVVRARSLLERDGRVVLVLDDCGGEVLREWARDHADDLPGVTAIGLEIAQILGHVHGAQIIHRDLKPDNILIADNRPILIDFGLSTRMPRTLAAAVHPSTLQGSLAYIAPEQTGRMNRAVDRRCDLYSLGATLYELIAGRPPFVSDDPAELVHAHIARVPIPLREIRPEVPPALSGIVDRLLAKDPEDRYQSALGLAADLRRVLMAISAHEVADFILGQHDAADRLQLSERIVGRQEELLALQAGLDRVIDGAIELALVTGPPGIGKSSLIGELQRRIGGRGFVLVGKFDALRRDEPYSAVREALEGLVRYVLSEEPAELARWRQSIEQAAGGTLSVLTDVLPALTQVVGVQPPLAEVTPSAAKYRFQQAVQCFLRVFARPRSPVLLCLDDLQWADVASLDLLSSLFSVGLGSLLIVGTYRSDEVGDGHPLRAMLVDVERYEGRVTELVLAPLEGPAVARIVAEALASSEAEIEPLVELVAARSLGNPLFIGELLRDAEARGHLRFDADAQRWCWDLEAIAAIPFIDDVMGWLAERIDALGEKTRDLLQIAACFGGAFVVTDLGAVVDVSAESVESSLVDAARAALLLQVGERCRFAHDRIHQSLLASMEPGRRRRVHLRIGRYLRSTASSGDDALFSIADHLNEALEFLEDPAERLGLADLNLRAVRKARASGAFEQASRYARAGIDLLDAGGWQSGYELAFELHHQAATCEFVRGDHMRARELLSTCMREARSDFDRMRVHASWAESALHLNRLEETIQHGREGLRLLGADLPSRGTPGTLIRDSVHAMRLVRRTSPDEIEQLPTASDINTWWTLKLYYHTSGAAFQADPALMTLIAMRATALSIERGATVFAAADFITYGIMLGSISQNCRPLERYGDLALRLLRRHEDRGVESVVKFLHGSFVSPLVHTYRDAIVLLREAFRAGCDSGMLVYAGLAEDVIVDLATMSGVPLSTCEGYAASARQYSRRTQLMTAEIARSARRDLVAALRFVGAREIGGSDSGDAIANAQRCLCRIEYAVYMRDSHGLYAGVAEIDKGIPLVMRMTHALPQYHLHRVIRFCFAAASGLPERPRTYMKVRSSLARLAKWAKTNPSNFHHLYSLASAEYSSLVGDHRAASRLYEEAIDRAHVEEFRHHEGLACELAGRHYLALGVARVADVYLTRARQKYVEWEADAVVARFDKDYPHINAPRRVQSGGSTSSQTGESIDLSALLKALAALSGEIHLDGLVRRLLHLSLENAGAERGWLVLDREGEWQVEAVASASDPDAVERPTPRWSADQLPVAILHYAARTREPVVLDDAANGGMFMHDAFVQVRRLRSVLCLPLVNQGRVLGLLYLENNLVSRAFTGQRTEILRFLASQAAVSLEIALLYQKLEEYSRTLEERVEDRTRALQRALDELRLAQRQMVESEKMAALGGLVAGVAHEINTPVGVGVTAASTLHERTRELQERYEAGAMTRADLEEYLGRAARGNAILLANLGRAVELIQSFKQIAVDQSSEAPRSFRVQEYLEQVILSLRPELKKTPHQIELSGPEDLVLQSFPGVFSQIVTNLVMNSLIHAWPRAEGVDTSSAGLMRIDFRRERDRFVLEYRDDGGGIEEDHVGRIFEPFFTTRRDHGGSGLGLYIVYNLVTQKLGGTIACESAPGRGVHFTLTMLATFVETDRTNSA